MCAGSVRRSGVLSELGRGGVLPGGGVEGRSAGSLRGVGELLRASPCAVAVVCERELGKMGARLLCAAGL